MANIQRIDFYGDTISTCKNEETGKVYCIPREMSEQLGIDWSSQWRKLQGSFYQKHTSRCDMTTTGGTQDTILLDVDFLPMWLSSISAEKVRSDVKEKLLAYQEECAQALRDYWYNGAALNPRQFSPEMIVQALAQGQISLTTRVEGIERHLASGEKEHDAKYTDLAIKYSRLEAAEGFKDQQLAEQERKLTTLQKQLNALTPPPGWHTLYFWVHDTLGEERQALFVMTRSPAHVNRWKELEYLEYLASVAMQSKGLIPEKFPTDRGRHLHVPYDIFRAALDEYLKQQKDRGMRPRIIYGNQKIQPNE